MVVVGLCAQTMPAQAQVTGRATLQTTAQPTSDPTTLLGLEEPAGGDPQNMPLLTLDDVLRAVDNAPDILVAWQQVEQAQAGVRRAWAAVLPSLAVSGGYTHNCTAGGPDVVQCGDRVASFQSREQTDQQALLFESIADVIGVAADFATSADEQDRLRREQQALRDAAANARNTETKPVVVQPASVWAATATLNVPLVVPRAYPAMMNADTALQVARMAREQALNTLRLQALRGYLSLVTADRLTEAARRQRDALLLHKEATAARVQAATAPALALKRAELDVLRAEQNLDQLMATTQGARAAVALLVGRSSGFRVELPTRLQLPVPTQNVDELVEQAWAQRPEMLLAQQQKILAERAVWDAWAQFLPSVGALVTARVTSFTQGFVSDPITGTLSLQASLPLYDGGLRYAAMRDANSRVQEQEIRVRQTHDRIAAQVRGNLREVAVRERAALLSAQALAVASEADEQAQASYQAGVGTALDASDAAVLRANAENDALRAELDVAQARAGLLFVVGRPLSMEQPAPSTTTTAVEATPWPNAATATPPGP
jgi:outer membrane protein TolC